MEEQLQFRMNEILTPEDFNELKQREAEEATDATVSVVPGA